jgi:hypothetical protein
MLGVNSKDLALDIDAGLRAQSRLQFDLRDPLYPVYYPSKESEGVRITLAEYQNFRRWWHMTDAIKFGPMVIWLLCAEFARRLTGLDGERPVISLAVGAVLLVPCYLLGRKLFTQQQAKLLAGNRQKFPPRPADYYDWVETVQQYETSRVPTFFQCLSFWLFAAGCAFLAVKGTYALWAKIGFGAASALLFSAPVVLLMLHWRTVARYREMMAAMGGKQVSR